MLVRGRTEGHTLPRAHSEVVVLAEVMAVIAGLVWLPLLQESHTLLSLWASQTAERLASHRWDAGPCQGSQPHWPGTCKAGAVLRSPPGPFTHLSTHLSPAGTRSESLASRGGCSGLCSGPGSHTHVQEAEHFAALNSDLGTGTCPWVSSCTLC